LHSSGVRICPKDSTTRVEQNGNVVAQQSPTQAASPAPTADNVSSSPQLAINNGMAEPPVPAEGPAATSQAPVSSESPPIAKNESAPPDLPNRTELAVKDPLATTASGDEPSSSPAHAAPASKRSDSNASKRRAAVSAWPNLPRAVHCRCFMLGPPRPGLSVRPPVETGFCDYLRGKRSSRLPCPTSMMRQ
jgi:hypothetical protein